VSEEPRNQDVTVDLPGSQRARQVREQFEAAWEASLRSGDHPPEPEAFLAGVAEADVTAVRVELDRVAQSYHQRLSGTALPGARTKPTGDDGTVPEGMPADVARAEGGGTERVAADAGPAEGSTGGRVLSGALLPADPFGTAAYAGGAKAPGDRPATPVPAEPVGGYEIMEELGRGAMGVVYRARQRGLKRTVALKMILGGAHAAAGDLERFRTEAEAVARLHHPNIVQIFEVGEKDGLPYFSLEYVDGGSLAKKVAGNPLPPRAAAELVVALARAIQYAHDQGIVHRDLKPANVLLTRDGQPKISDFGLAKRLGEASSRTRDGSVLGTPSYMPPEQADGRAGAVGPLADVYALGAILYELLTGRAPFRAATVWETLDLVRSQDPVAPSQLQPGTPRDLETICLKCLQKDPAKRYASAAALADDLGRYLAGEPIRARPVPAWERAWRWCRRNPTVAALGAAVVLLLTLGLAGTSAFSVVIYNEKNATDEALRLADANAELAKKNQARAEKNAQAALRVQEAAVHNLIGLASQTQKKLRRKVTNPQLEAELRPIRDDLLNGLRQRVITLANELEKAELTSFGMAAAQQQLGDVCRDLGMPAEAMKHYEQAEQLAKKVAEDQPDDDRARANWALMLARLADMERELRADLPKAHGLYRQALELQQDVQDHPRSGFYKPVDHQRIKANYLFKLGEVSKWAGDPAAARKYFEESARLRRAWLEHDENSLPARGFLAEATLWLADVCGRLGDAQAMQAHFKEGSAQVAEILRRKDHHDFKADQAETFLMYGDALWREGQYDEARTYYEKCPPLLTIAINKEPENLRYLGLVARLQYARGLAAARAKDAVAEARFADALKWQEKLLAIDTEGLPAQVGLAVCLARNGKRAEAVAKADALRPRVAKDPGLLVRLAGAYALCAAGASDPAEKQRYTDQALDILRTVVKAGFKDAVYLRTHPDLDSLADEAAFRELLVKVR
jgi:serine/threonine-protein kinase